MHSDLNQASPVITLRSFRVAPNHEKSDQQRRQPPSASVASGCAPRPQQPSPPRMRRGCRAIQERLDHRHRQPASRCLPSRCIESRWCWISMRIARTTRGLATSFLRARLSSTRPHRPDAHPHRWPSPASSGGYARRRRRPSCSRWLYVCTFVLPHPKLRLRFSHSAAINPVI